MRISIILTFLFFSVSCFSQSLSLERVKKLKAATVRITIENSNSIGTGFFIDEGGLLLTCWHVIEPAIIRDGANNITGLRKISVTINDTIKVEFGIPLSIFNDSNLYRQCLAYDFSILVPSKKLTSKQVFLKLGDFNSVTEGQEVITCGYPIGIEQKFITKGIVSTKYIDTSIAIYTPYGRTKYDRSQALMDITMNRGNSGGAVVLLGNTINDDVVIGIADFIINPIGGIADTLIKQFDNSSTAVFIGGIDPNKTFSDFTKIISSISIGVSGCVSINHIKSSLGIK